MKHKEMLGELVEAAETFIDRRLWRRFTNSDCFGVRWHDQSEPMLGVILGAAGEEYGLSLFRGPRAGTILGAMQRCQAPSDDLLEGIDALGFSMQPFVELPADDRSLLRKAGRHPQKKQQVPMFLVTLPGHRASQPDASELDLLRRVLWAVLEADERGELHPAELRDKQGICVLELGGDPVGPGVSVKREQWDRSENTASPPSDLAEWKAADRRLNDRISEHMTSGPRNRFNSTRAATRYFGDDDLKHHVTQHRQQMVVEAYLAWIVLDYRPTKTSKTVAEQMLKKGLPEPETLLLRARMEACPSLYRVADHDPRGGTLELEDVLLGGRVTVHDTLMSAHIENNLFVVLRAYRAGRFRFIEPAGPPLGPMMGSQAVAFLQYCDMAFTPAGVRQDAHKFGWLWAWMEQWQSSQPSRRMCNTDGEPFVWHTASFSVADPQSTQAILHGRDDIDYDDQQDEFVWFKETGPDSKMIGDTVTLGRIEFVADELVLTVNSARRLKVARVWLEALPGITVCDVQTRAWDEAEEDRPLDDRIAGREPVEITSEMTVALQAMMDKQYMGWVDTSLPTLDHQTPREACRTEAGRQRVAMLIRTIPDPMGPAPVRVPREALLRELGLPTAGNAAPTSPSRPGPGAPIVIQSIPPAAGKVGRNAPCPCGSGRKYKKCCGGGQSVVSHQ